MDSMKRRDAENETIFSDRDVAGLAARAVSRLIADAKSGRLEQNRELADVIEGCIRHSSIKVIRDLKLLLDQQDLERPASRA